MSVGAAVFPLSRKSDLTAGRNLRLILHIAISSLCYSDRFENQTTPFKPLVEMTRKELLRVESTGSSFRSTADSGPSAVMVLYKRPPRGAVLAETFLGHLAPREVKHPLNLANLAVSVLLNDLICDATCRKGLSMIHGHDALFCGHRSAGHGRIMSRFPF